MTRTGVSVAVDEGVDRLTSDGGDLLGLDDQDAVGAETRSKDLWSQLRQAGVFAER